MKRQVVGLMALTLFASTLKTPFYSGGQCFKGCGKFDANEVKKARKNRKRKVTK